MTIISTNVSNAGGTAVAFDAEYQTIIVQSGVVVEASGPGYGVHNSFAHTQLINNGTIAAKGFAVNISGAGDDVWVANAAGAMIVGAIGVSCLGDDLKVSNAGMIIGNQLHGLELRGKDADVRNLAGGAIHGDQTGIRGLGADLQLSNQGSVSGGVAGLDLAGNGAVINNGSEGSISGGAYGVLGAAMKLFNNGSVAGETAVHFSGASRVTNHGAFEGGANGVVASTGTGARIYNHGDIQGEINGIKIAASTGATTVVVNTGTISGGTGGITVTSNSAVKLVNQGLIEGGLALANKADVVTNAGLISGNVILGGGDDNFRGARGSVDGNISGGAGNDRLVAGDGDTVLGESGDDYLIGGGVENTLIGGAGADILKGGRGVDSFTYLMASDSPVVGHDFIVGFGYADGDRVDLSAIDAAAGVAGNQAFAFIGDAAFSNAAGELRAEVAGSFMIVEGDVDGDGAADFRIAIANVYYVDATDFVL